jgi:hypothetical protein
LEAQDAYKRKAHLFESGQNFRVMMEESKGEERAVFICEIGR